MISRIRNAAGLALLLAAVTSMAVLAKGGFSFISITGPGIDEEIRATDLKLTEDFFAFADFSRDKVQAPVETGDGYTITRYYIDGKREIAFDQLHYYPSTGFVFYDGIVNGDSEYDGEWYSANPAVKAVFEGFLPATGSTIIQPVQQTEKQPAASTLPLNALMPLATLAGLLALAALVLRLRKPVIQ